MTAETGDRGWGRVLALSFVCIALFPFQPALLVFVPFGLLALALPPYRPVTVAAGLILLAGALVGIRPEGQAAIQRGWVLVVGGWFVLAVTLLPRHRFVSRGLLALAGGLVSVVGFLALRSDALARLDATISGQLRDTASMTARAAGRLPGRMGSLTPDMIRQVTEVQVLLYPAMFALATLAGLAVAWWAWGRLAMRPDGSLAPLRDFRFSDGLVWVLILGLVLVLLPRTPELATRAGTNLLVFIGALYALRGVGVLLFLSGVPGPLGLLLTALAVVLVAPLVMVTTFFVGLFDTWLDIRRHRPASTGSDA